MGLLETSVERSEAWAWRPASHGANLIAPRASGVAGAGC